MFYSTRLRMLIFHRMQNLIPLHKSMPFRYLFSFSSFWLLKYNQQASTRNAYFIHRIILEHYESKQYAAQTYCDITVMQWYVSLCNGTISCMFSSHWLIKYTTSLLHVYLFVLLFIFITTVL